MKKKISWFEILLAILLLALIGLLTYNVILAKQQNNKVKPESKPKQEVKKEKEEEPEIGEELSLTDSRVTNLMSPFKAMNLDCVEDYFGYFYEQEKNEVTTLPDDVKIFLAIKTMEAKLDQQAIDKYPLFPDDLPTIVVSGSEVATAMKQLYGNVPYNNVSLKGSGCGYSGFKYDANTNSYSQKEPACGGTLHPYYDTIIREAKLYKDRIEINLLVGYIEYEITNKVVNEKIEKVLYNSKTEKKEATRTTVNLPPDPIDITKGEKQLHEYKFTFKLNEDQSYSFVSANRVR